MITDHCGIDISPRKPSFVLLLMSGALVILLIFTGLLKKVLIACRIMSEDPDIEVDEGLGTYAQSLSEASRKVWLIEQKHLKALLGCQTVTEEFQMQMKRETYHQKQIRGVPSYEITKNPRYADAFQYTAVEMRDTQQEKENSDFVLKHLYLAYCEKPSSSLVASLNHGTVV